MLAPLRSYLTMSLQGPCGTDKSMVSASNVFFVKLLNLSLAVSIIWTVTPPAHLPIARLVHVLGSVVYAFSGVVNIVSLMWISPRRPGRTFDPLSIVSMTASMPLFVIADFFYVLYAAPKYVAFTIGLPCVLFLGVGHWGAHSWFESSVVLDVWMFHLFFFYRKLRWLRENFRDSKAIVRYFKTTCWFRIECAPTAEFIYAATTGHINTLGLQLGKLVALVVCKQLGCLPFLQAVFVCGAIVRQPIIYLLKSADTHKLLNLMLMRQHKWAHLNAVAHVTVHFDHHDVVPVASIGSASTGFQEAIGRSVGIVPYYDTIWNGYSGFFMYLASTLDEWEHNCCPTAARSGVIATQFIHLEHHMNHALPLGVVAEDEKKYGTGWSWDKQLWENIQRFVPELILDYEQDPDIGAKYLEGDAAFINLVGENQHCAKNSELSSKNR